MTRAFDVAVIGAGPAGVMAALRAAELGARTTLVTRGDFGGMAANDGPVPVRTLAHAARLIREARQLGRYGIAAGEPALDYAQLLVRVREVVGQVRRASAMRGQCESAGVVIQEHSGPARFVDPHTIATESGLRLRAEKIILCTGGTSRSIDVPGVELTATHSDAWSLSSVPSSMIVIGGGATGAQVASIFNAFGARVQLFEMGPRILATEDHDVAAAVATAFREDGITIREGCGTLERFEETSRGVRVVRSHNSSTSSDEAELVVLAVGWSANSHELSLDAAGVTTDARGMVRVDEYLRTSTPHVFAAGDVTGRLMLAPQALHAGFVAATNAVRGPTEALEEQVSPMGSFTDPEYAQVGLTEARAREKHDVEVVTVGFDSLTRAIIDGRTTGFLKLVVDRGNAKILGCHVVGERAVDVVQLAAIAITAGMKVDELARVPLSFPTYAGILGRAALTASHRLGQASAPDETRPEVRA